MFISRQKAVLTAVIIMAAGVSPCGARADSSVIFDEVQLVNTLHTHLYPSSKSLPSFDEFQIAAVCFINDTEACSDFVFSGSDEAPSFDLNPEDRCKNEGYTVRDCPDGYKLGGKKCPYGPYYTECISICPSSYVSCEEPYYGVGEACDNKYASCSCEPCGSGYDYTTIPSGYVQDGASCLDCDGQTKYKVKVNPCDGFQDCGSMGGAAGAETCQSGTITKYDNCKPCPNLGTYTSCPSGSVCEYEDCSGLWYAIGCQSGYTDYCDYCAM